MTDWPETNALLERFRAWLDQVREESLSAGSEPVAAPVAGDATAAAGTTRRRASLGSSTWFASSRPCGTRSNCRRRAGGGWKNRPRRPSPRWRRPAGSSAPSRPRGRGGPAGGLALDRSDGRSRRGPRRAQAAVESARQRLDKSQAAFSGRLADLDAAQPAWKRWLCHSWYAAAATSARPMPRTASGSSMP